MTEPGTAHVVPCLHIFRSVVCAVLNPCTKYVLFFREELQPDHPDLDITSSDNDVQQVHESHRRRTSGATQQNS